MTNTWLTNTTLDDITEQLRDSQSVVLLTHDKPDGDALGSTLALARALTRLGVEATPVYFGAWPKRFDPIVASTHTLMLGDEPDLDLLPKDPSRIVIADTGAWSQLSKVRPWLEPRAERAVVIDHHLHGDTGTAPARHIETAAAAVCQTIAELCRRLLCVERINELPGDIATPLYLGLATDTGWFRHSNVTPTTLRCAADLLEAGADHSALYRLTEQMERPSRLRIIGRALSSLSLCAEDAVAVMSITRGDLKDVGADSGDSGGLTDMLLSMAPVRVAACLTEVSPTRTKISFRSKTGTDETPTIDVNKIARSLGGGGHAQAAGARLECAIDQAREQTTKAMTDALL